MNVALQMMLNNAARPAYRPGSLSETFNRAASGAPRKRRTSLTEEFNRAAGNDNRGRGGARFTKMVEMPEGSHETPLEYAVRSGNKDVAKKLLDAVSEDAKAQFPHHPPANDPLRPAPPVVVEEASAQPAEPQQAPAKTAEEPAAPAAVDHSVNHYEGRLAKYIKLNRGK